MSTRLLPWLLLTSIATSSCASERSLRKDYLEGLDHQKAGRAYEAAEVWQNLIAQRSDLLGPRTNLAIVEFERGRTASAVRLLEQELAIDNTQYATRLARAIVAYRQGDLALANRVATSLVASYPEAPAAGLVLSRIRYDRGDALASFTKPLTVAMEDRRSNIIRSRAYHLHGLALLKDGQASLAADALSRAAEFRSDAIARYNQSVALLAAGRSAEATAPLEQAAALDPGAYQIPRLQALVALRQGNDQAAQGFLADCRRLAGKKDIEADAIVGTLALRAKRYPEARAAFEAAVKRHPKHAAYWSNLGLAALHTDDATAALRAFETANALAPSPALQQTISRIAATVRDAPAP